MSLFADELILSLCGGVVVGEAVGSLLLAVIVLLGAAATVVVLNLLSRMESNSANCSLMLVDNGVAAADEAAEDPPGEDALSAAEAAVEDVEKVDPATDDEVTAD